MKDKDYQIITPIRILSLSISSKIIFPYQENPIRKPNTNKVLREFLTLNCYIFTVLNYLLQ